MGTVESPKNCIVFFFALIFALPVVCRGEEGIVVFRIDFDNPIFSRLDEEGRNVLREYAKVYPKIKHFYGNIRMDVTQRTYRLTADKGLTTHIPLNSPPILEREELFEVRYNTRDGDARDGGFSRVDSQIKFIQGAIFSQNHRREINLITPEAGYALSKRNSNRPFYSLHARRDHDTFMHTIGVKVLEFDTAPFSVGPMQMENLFFKPPFFARGNYFVISARYIEDQGEQIVELISLVDNPPRSSMWVARLCREKWVVRDALYQGWTAAGKRYQRYRCVYDGEFEGMPLLVSYQIDRGIYDADEAQTERPTSQTRYEVTKLVPGAPDLSEFDVAQFLPPGARIGEITSGGLTPGRVAAIIIGIILVILGIYLRIRSAKEP